MFRKLIFIMMLGATAQASELTHEFGNPAFSGNGYSQHVLSIEQLQYSRKKDVEEASKSAAAAAKGSSETTIAIGFLTRGDLPLFSKVPWGATPNPT